jgi:hypothetical protein
VNAPAQQELAAGVARRWAAFCAAPYSGSVVMGKEPWRERPRLRALNPFPRAFKVVHATVPGGLFGDEKMGRIVPTRVFRSLRPDNAPDRSFRYFKASSLSPIMNRGVVMRITTGW